MARADINNLVSIENVCYRSRLEGGKRWSGSSGGRSCPSSLTLIRCIAKANSSASSRPSLSMSDNFQIFPSTELGSFDFTISLFAAEK